MLPVGNSYIGEIVNAELSEDKAQVVAIVFVRPDGSPETARWRGTFSDTQIRSGKNEGRSWGEVTAETLGEFGITDFSRIAELKGKKCSFGIKHNPGDDGKIWVEVNFIAPPRAAKPVTSAGLAGLAKFKGAALEAAKKAGVTRQAAPMREPGDDGYDAEHDPFR